MATRSVQIPVLPSPPSTYVPSFMTELVRVIGIISQVIRNPGEVVAHSLTLTGLLNTDMGLPQGGVFEVNGALRISVPYMPHVSGATGSGAVGAVTVSTP